VQQLWHQKKKSDLAGTENGKGGIDTVQKAKQSMTKDNAYSPPKKDTVKPEAKPIVKPDKHNLKKIQPQ
jgi:hypothetical protein